MEHCSALIICALVLFLGCEASNEDERLFRLISRPSIALARCRAACRQWSDDEDACWVRCGAANKKSLAPPRPTRKMIVEAGGDHDIEASLDSCGMLHWTEVSDANAFSVVYLVFSKDASGTWHHLGQTARAEFRAATLATMERVRILAVTAQEDSPAMQLATVRVTSPGDQECHHEIEEESLFSTAVAVSVLGIVIIGIGAIVICVAAAVAAPAAAIKASKSPAEKAFERSSKVTII
jgi:hypothetical protein